MSTGSRKWRVKVANTSPSFTFDHSDFRLFDVVPIIVLPPNQRLSPRPDTNTEMTHSADASVESLDDLRAFVAATLGDHEQLAPGAFPLTERLLHRGGRPCGIQFCLIGPRSVRLTAIWEIESQSVLFYDSNGERFRRVQLSKGLPEIPTEEQAA